MGGVQGIFAAQLGDADAGVDQPAQGRQLGHAGGVVAGRGHRGYGLGQGMQERGATHIGQRALPGQLALDRDRVNRVAAADQESHRPIHGPVGGPVEVVLGQPLQHDGQGLGR
jgi:hypothetical protein